MQAIILAGGRGSRLRPLTDTIPKVMAPIKSIPFISYLLHLLKKGGVDEAVISVGYLPLPIMHFVTNGDKWGLRVSYCNEEKPLGTAGALKFAEPMLHDNFLVINGDTYLPIDHRLIMERFLWTGKDAMVVAYKNNLGCLNDLFIKDGHILKCAKRTPTPDFNYVNAGVVAMRKKALQFISAGKQCGLEDRFYQCLINLNLLAAYTTEQCFYDIGTFAGIKRLEDYLDNYKNSLPC